MTMLAAWRAAVLAAICVLIVSVSIGALQASYSVERIIDGDTVVLTGVGTVRLIGVDAPETVEPRSPVGAFGKEASAFLTGMLAGKRVRLEYDQTRTDRYQRTLAYLYLPDNTFVNREIVRQGYSHVYTEYPFRFMEDFRAAEREARTAGRGLWSGAQPAAAPLPLVSAPQPVASAATVYVTRTGEKYHRAGCRYLARSQIPMSLPDAAARYGPCSVCRPPTVR
jgi:micrococcal nuclease